MDIIKLIKIVALFMLGVALIYMPIAYLRLWRKNQKGKTWAENRQAVKVYIKHDDIHDWLRIISVNGETPVTFTEGAAKQGFYLNAGQNTVVALCQWSQLNPFSPLGYNTHSAGSEELNLYAEAGKQYSFSYSHTTEKYEFEEMKR